MTINAPVVEWYNVDRVNPNNSNKVQVSQPYDFGIVDAGYIPTESDYYSFLIWNNRGNLLETAPQMEDVTLGIKDVDGGNGSTLGKEVWAINGSTKWFWAKVESLNETDADFAEIGATLTRPIGTNGSTTNPAVASATTWTASTSYVSGNVVSPTSDNGFVYKAQNDGATNTTQPTWATVEGETVTDGTITWEAIKKINTPVTSNIILGGLNDGTLDKAQGNYTKVTLKIEAPLDARSGRQDLKLRVSYRYI